MTKKEIHRKVEDWITILGLGHWSISIVFDEPKVAKNIGSYEEMAFCDALPQYLTATIHFRPSKLKYINEDDIIHELLHCVTAEFVGYANANKKDKVWLDYFNEKLVSHLTQTYSNHYIWLKNHK